MRHLLILTGLLVGLAGCSTPTGPDHRRVIGFINGGSIVAPDTVQVDSWFTATILTFGSSSCTRPDGAELTLRPSEAQVTPYDLVSIPTDSRSVCTADLAPHPHPVKLRFTTAGPAIIVVLGEVEVMDADFMRWTQGAVTKQLVVLP
jgi:hypothetical protein